MWTADHTCGRREAVDESGEQPEEQPNRPETVTGSERPRALSKRQRGRQGRERNESKGEPEEDSNTLHVIFHLANATTPTTAAAAAATAAMRLQ